VSNLKFSEGDWIYLIRCENIFSFIGWVRRRNDLLVRRASEIKTKLLWHEPTVTIATKNINAEVGIRVRDNGNGMSAAVKEKIFQPFFTTKPTGEGTGLGLSLAYDIITKARGGEIILETKGGVRVYNSSSGLISKLSSRGNMKSRVIFNSETARFTRISLISLIKYCRFCVDLATRVLPFCCSWWATGYMPRPTG
jgi:hypothetical protein